MTTRGTTPNERGFAVPMALLVIVALGMVAAAAAYMSAGDTNAAGLFSTSNRTADAAAAGLEHAVAQYDERLDLYPGTGDLADFLLAVDWPLDAEIDGYEYSVTAQRDSFDFDGDGDMEAVYCSPGTGDGGDDDGDDDGGDGGDDGDDGDDDESEDIGDAPGGDSGDYWEEPNGGDKNNDGDNGLAGGHFDPDVFIAGNKRLYHQHQFDDKYDTTKVEIRDDPHLLWDEVLDTYSGGPLTLTWNNEDAAPGWYRITLVNGTVYENLNRDAVSHSFNPNQVASFRIQFTSLIGFACTNPGAVKSDAVDRDGAFTLYLKDASGNLVYEFSTYWHNKTDDCVPEDDHDPEEGDKGDDKNSDDLELDPSKAAKYCNEYAKKIADAEEYMEKAQAKYDEADELEEEGDSKKAAKKRAEGDALVAKANQKYTEAGIQCDLANDYGTCACSTEPGWEDEEEEETPGGGDGGLVCDLNGDGDGQPVFLLTSTATRNNVYRATQRMRVTMDETLSKVWRISWSAD